MTTINPATRCTLCTHREDQHDVLPDGTRPCRSVGHEKGLTCAACRRLTGPQHVEAVMELREEPDDAFEEAWAAYYATLNHVRDQIGPGWQAFFSDVHQSALASAIIAYRAEQPRASTDSAAATGPTCEGCGDTAACAGGPCAHPDAAGTSSTAPADEAWGSVWLHGNWRFMTGQMGTEAREHAAATVLRWMHGLDAIDGRPPRTEPEDLRWWLHT